MLTKQCAACSGGVFLNHWNFDLHNLTLSGNAAYYGAGLYVSTDVTSNATLSSLALSDNVGMLGASHRKGVLTGRVSEGYCN